MASVGETNPAHPCLLHELLRLTPKLVRFKRATQFINDHVARVLIDLPGLLLLPLLPKLESDERHINGLGQREHPLAVVHLGLLLNDLVALSRLINILSPPRPADLGWTLGDKSQEHDAEEPMILARLDKGFHFSLIPGASLRRILADINEQDPLALMGEAGGE
ncbi:hypothetical protein M878_06110 [Streptomyces roseochromogenus subsp. oscitans DS 12.976]|uniref:Uncharacterized protein n=1 Tax=Streptomyces roseochromogenus subsp. oscitans DS 12.976 TaxID=1352936 RepID=V6KTC6_STRRC|nr:hypothetical protein [Streptomyces roseochromogenus]EST35392.1 hypothetical protein M878_06110 [Streptomyces roseochromogenus subsp. oscitans DS 12.976]